MKTLLLLLLVLCVPLHAATVIWDNSNSTGQWSTGANWSTNVEPSAFDDVQFPAVVPGSPSITLGTGELALSLLFDNTYTLGSGSLTLGAGGISVASGAIATINSVVNGTGGLAKNGAGTLVLGGSNGFSGGLALNNGIVRLTNGSGAGAAANVVTINSGTALEVSSVTLDRAITANDGGMLRGLGASAVSNGKLTATAAATFTLATSTATDVLSLGNAANDLSGGAGGTLVVSGAGAVRLNQAADFSGAWRIDSGTLQLANAGALGTATAATVLNGGALSGRLAANTTFTGPVNLTVNTDSSLISDRSSGGGGVTYTFGALGISAQTLTVAPGANATSGTAGITLGNVTVTGNPTLAVNDAGATNGKLTTGSITGGGMARTITKTGDGDLAITGGATDLIAGSALNQSGAGVLELLFPTLGAGASITPTAAQHPLGAATFTLGGGLRLLADGDATSTAQTFVLDHDLAMSGNFLLEVDRRTTGTNKVFQVGDLTLAANTVLSISANNGFKITAQDVVMNGDATIQGSTSKTTVLSVNSILGTGALTLGGPATHTLNIAAASTRTGATTITGGIVNANAAGALGSGSLALNGGTLNTTNGLGVSGISFGGGTLSTNGTGSLTGVNTVTMSSGTFTLRDTSSATGTAFSFSGGTLNLFATPVTDPAPSPGEDEPSIGTPPLDLLVETNGVSFTGGTTTIVPDSSSAGTFPNGSLTLGGPITISGSPTITVTTAAKTLALNFDPITLNSDVTINPSSSTTIARTQGGLSEDASPRKLIKAGGGRLVLNGVSTHSGGTEINAGILHVAASNAAGSGDILLGPTSGSATSELRIDKDVTLANDITVRSGGTGTVTISRVADFSGADPVFGGDLTLQRAVTINNTTNISTEEPLTLGGRISGAFNLTISGSQDALVRLTNVTNDFGAGAANSVTVSAARLSVGSDSALGLAANGLTFASFASLRAEQSFSTARTITLNSATTFETPAGVTLTLASGIAGTTTSVLTKRGTGTLAFGSAASSSGRGTAQTIIEEGVVQLTSASSLSVAGPVQINGVSEAPSLHLLNDSDTNYAHALSIGTAGAIVHVDRSPGGGGVNGRHTLGTLNAGVTVTGDHGYGLSLGATSLGSTPLTNHAPGELRLASLTTSGSTASLGGSGNTAILGTLTTPIVNHTLTKTGAGTLKLGSGVTTTIPALTLQAGLLDLNGLSISVGVLALDEGNIAPGSGTVTVLTSLASITGGQTWTGTITVNTADRVFSIANGAAASDLIMDGAITGTGGILKEGAGTLRFTGAADPFAGVMRVGDGVLELANTPASTGGLTSLSLGRAAIQLSTTARWLAGDQLADSGVLALRAETSGPALIDLNGHSETVGGLSITSNGNGRATVQTGAAGVLRVGGDITLTMQSFISASLNGREILISGTGTRDTIAPGGTLDLLGGVRTISLNAATATIETQIINGGLIKTGTGRLLFGHPTNLFSGGLEVQNGSVEAVGDDSFGAGIITIAPAGTNTARVVLTDSAGFIGVPVTVAGSPTGVAELLDEGSLDAGGVVGGAITLQRDLTVNVKNGITNDFGSAELEIDSTINDGASSFGLIKTGDGNLFLPNAKQFSGSLTIKRGRVINFADDNLGDANAPLILDGGCWSPFDGYSTPRGLTFLSGGGSVRAPDFADLEITGPVVWHNTLGAIAAFYGEGRVILSGSTTSGIGNAAIGSPLTFAAVPAVPDFAIGTTLSLQGTAQLPTGHLEFVNDAVLELGNGDFTRTLTTRGTVTNSVSLITSNRAGWAALEANRIVNLGGAGATLLWGTTGGGVSFLNDPSTPVDSALGNLVLGSIDATHTVDFQNGLNLNFYRVLAGVNRFIQVPDGPAALEAIMSGDITQPDVASGRFNTLSLHVDGKLDISGDISGRLDLFIGGGGNVGTAVLSGANSFTGDIIALESTTLVVAGNASLGSPVNLRVDSSAAVDASAFTTPLTVAPAGEIEVRGLLTGDVLATASLRLWGRVNGDLTTGASTQMTTTFGNPRVDGDFNFVPGGNWVCDIAGIAPLTGFERILAGGGVSLGGGLTITVITTSFTPVVGQQFKIIDKTSAGPISGTFAGKPESSTFSTTSGHQFSITYAGGDGNDVVLTLVAVPPTLPPAIIQSFTLTDGTGPEAGLKVFDLQATGEPGVSYTIEASIDLETFTDLQTLTAEAITGALAFHVTQPSTFTRRFFRVRRN